LLLGAHISTAGGSAAAPSRAKALAATAMQIFTKQASRWAERECDPAERSNFRAALADTDVTVTAAHDSY
jgi:deoxyribonuclease-4